jgi:predicted transcriptional regulator
MLDICAKAVGIQILLSTPLRADPIVSALTSAIALDKILDVFMDKKKDLHIFLQDDVLQNLGRFARERRVTRAHLVREAITEYLSRKEAERIEQEMARYVKALADESGDFIAETDAHTIHRLLRETKW